MSVFGFFCVEVVVVYSYFYLFGYVVGIKIEGKVVVRVCWLFVLFSWRGLGSAK